MKNIYSVKSNYDGHFINDILNTTNHIKYTNRKFLNNGEIFSVEPLNYHDVLNYVTSGLLRRNPTEEVKWIDYNDNERPYDTFCFAVIKLKQDFIDNTILELFKNNITNIFNNSEPTRGKAPINIEIAEDGYIFLEGKIYYDNLSNFWKDLRLEGLRKTFAERQNYCIDTIKNNSNSFENCVEAFYVNDIDVYFDETLDKTNEIIGKPNHQTENSYTKMLKID